MRCCGGFDFICNRTLVRGTPLSLIKLEDGEGRTPIRRILDGCEIKTDDITAAFEDRNGERGA